MSNKRVRVQKFNPTKNTEHSAHMHTHRRTHTHARGARTHHEHTHTHTMITLRSTLDFVTVLQPAAIGGAQC